MPAADGEILIEDAPDLDLQLGILPRARRQHGGLAPSSHAGVIDRGAIGKTLQISSTQCVPRLLSMKAIVACKGDRTLPSQNKRLPCIGVLWCAVDLGGDRRHDRPRARGARSHDQNLRTARARSRVKIRSSSSLAWHRLLSVGASCNPAAVQCGRRC